MVRIVDVILPKMEDMCFVVVELGLGGLRNAVLTCLLFKALYQINDSFIFISDF